MPILPSHSPPNLLETPLRQNSTDLTISFTAHGSATRGELISAALGKGRSWQRENR